MVMCARLPLAESQHSSCRPQSYK